MSQSKEVMKSNLGIPEISFILVELYVQKYNIEICQYKVIGFIYNPWYDQSFLICSVFISVFLLNSNC